LRNDKRELLLRELKLLDEANKILVYSYEACSEIGIKDNYTLEELDKFEALTSRFARISDILIQRIFRLMDIWELEMPGSVIDRINRAEKRNLISSAEVFKEIRYLRNEIAHEYIPLAIEQIFKEVLRLTPHIIDSVERIRQWKPDL
jgi:uncharacterized protein YutE (UPF0331/DUF86 family)